MLGSSSPDMTAVFHPWADLTFVEIEDSSRSQKSLRTEERANHLTGFFRNRENVGVPPKIKSEFKTKESFKAWGLLEGRTVHLNRTKTWAVPLVMEGPKFGFRGVEGNKPPLAPLYNLLKV